MAWTCKAWRFQPVDYLKHLSVEHLYSTDMDDARTADPVVVGANWYRFRSREHIRHDHVESCAFIWVVKGSGTITSCGESFSMTTTSVVRLPWKHDVEYRPDPDSPFHLGTIHIIPKHARTVPVEFRVGFEPGDPIIGTAWRRGPTQPGAPVAMSSLASPGRNVVALASYCVERFLSERVSETAMRSLAVLVAEESAEWGQAVSSAQAVPPVLELMIDHILSNLDRSLTVAEIAEAGQCSPSTAERAFNRHTGLSVQGWTRRRRMQEAALLLRTSGLRVNEVARHVGYADPLHFSRVFRAIHGIPPSRYASEHLRP